MHKSGCQIISLNCGKVNITSHTEKIKIVFFIGSCFPYYSGGRESYLYEFCKNLHDEFDITIVSLKNWYGHETLIHSVFELPVKIYQVPSLFSIFHQIAKNVRKNVFTIYTFFALQTLTSYFSASTFIFSKFFFSKGKIVFVSLNPGLAYFPLILMRRKRFRRVCTVQGRWSYEVAQYFKKIGPLVQKIFICIEKLSYKHADLILPNGFHTERWVVLLCKNTNKIKLLPNAIDLKKFTGLKKQKINRDFKKIVAIATLRDIKGTPDLIKSISYIKKNYEDPLKVYFIGKGNFTPYLKLAKELGVEEYVEFLGERKDIPEILTDGDISVNNFGGGGIPTVTLESMASGTPIVALDNFMYTQILKHGYSAYLVKLGDAEALGKGIAYLLKNDVFASFLATNAKKEVEKYSMDKLSQKFSSLLIELFDSKS